MKLFEMIKISTSNPVLLKLDKMKKMTVYEKFRILFNLYQLTPNLELARHEHPKAHLNTWELRL